MAPDYLPLVLKAQHVPKLWGFEYWIVNTDRYCFKLLGLIPGYQCSLHYHQLKDETFVVYSGEIVLEQRDVRTFPFEESLRAGDKRHIAPRTPHRFRAVGEMALVFEIS